MKPSIPKGTRDFGPKEMSRRNYIFSVITKYFQLYGFQQIETPAMENISTLMGKYGEEGDKLIFKILNSGNYLGDVPFNEAMEVFSKLDEIDHEKLEKLADTPELKGDITKLKLKDIEEEIGLDFTKYIVEKALRYDLTVPFARYVVQHQSEITFPFRRYQVQPVWRADRPQKGRYREFYQCDADVIGTDSLLNEIELIYMMQDVYNELKIPVTIKMNNRKVLTGIAEVIGEKEKIVDITVAIDKLDKIGKDAVNAEMKEKGISDDAISKLMPLFDIVGDNYSRLNGLQNYLSASAIGLKGIEEIRFILDQVKTGHDSLTEFEIDITLARGLNYYTGSIFEVKTRAGEFKSSILGGGRYDDLTGIFGLPNLSGVGISFGIDRTYDVMEELGLFSEDKLTIRKTQLLFANFGKNEELECLRLARELRNNGISCEVYPVQTKKMQKQFEYAEKKGIAFMCFVGSEEIASGIYPLKNILTGDQEKLNLREIISKLK